MCPRDLSLGRAGAVRSPDREGRALLAAGEVREPGGGTCEERGRATAQQRPRNISRGREAACRDQGGAGSRRHGPDSTARERSSATRSQMKPPRRWGGCGGRRPPALLAAGATQQRHGHGRSRLPAGAVSAPVTRKNTTQFWFLTNSPSRHEDRHRRHTFHRDTGSPKAGDTRGPGGSRRRQTGSHPESGRRPQMLRSLRSICKQTSSHSTLWLRCRLYEAEQFCSVIRSHSSCLEMSNMVPVSPILRLTSAAEGLRVREIHALTSGNSTKG